MKKLLLLFVATSALFFSCNKDKNKDTPSLTGTTWTEVEDNVSFTLRFSQLEATYTIVAGTSSTSAGYSYEYNHPVVMMFPKEANNATLQGTINGSSLTLVNLSSNRTINVLTKK